MPRFTLFLCLQLFPRILPFEGEIFDVMSLPGILQEAFDYLNSQPVNHEVMPRR